MTINRSIISGNNGEEIRRNGGTINANNRNLFGHSGVTNAQAFVNFAPGASDRTATSDGTIPTPLGNILNTTLADNGGPTLTHALVSGSPAIDYIPTTDANCNPGVTRDQRGAFRGNGVGFGGSACDIGAFEFASAASFPVSAITGSGNGVISPALQQVTVGLDAEFTVVPNPGWSVGSVTGDTCDPVLDSGDQWIAENITQACSVTANFAQDSFAVTASVASGQGDITPPTQNVNFDGTATFTVTPQTGWSIDTVVGNTCSPGLVSGDQWQASNITSDCAVQAFFEFACPAEGGIIHVNAGAAGGGDGLSWSDAFEHLQDALALAQSCTLGAVSIWVAGGSYYPDRGAAQTPGDRTATFQLLNNVAVYGGFAGTETASFDLDQRDFDANETILSGNIDQSATNDNNSYTVVTASGTNASAILDGFIITAGNASENVMDSTGRGGGMYNQSSSPSLSNITFSGNTASDGGGMYNFVSSPNLSNITFSGNTASGDGGGGMCNETSSPSLSNVTFSGNTASGDGGGGGMYNFNNSSPSLVNVTFSGNTASDGVGGGMYNFSNSSPSLVNVTFSGNHASSGFNFSGFGGGMFNFNNSSPNLFNVTFSGNTADLDGCGMYNFDSSSPSLVNVTFSGNNAGGDGGGMSNGNSSPSLVNVTFSGNTASGGFGGGMHNFSNSSPSLVNTLLAGNTAPFGPDVSGPVDGASRHNLIGDGSGLSGISDGVNGNQVGTSASPIDPLLADLADYGGPTETLALLPGSPAIEAGDNAACADPDTVDNLDQRGIARPQGGTCDIGAFESRGFSLALVSGNSQSTLVETTFAGELMVEVASDFDEPVDGGRVVFVAPDSGASLSDEISLATIVDGDAALTATANDVSGSYNVIAGAAGSDDSATFNLTNLPQEFEVTASVASGHGSINPSSQNVIDGGTATFTVTPDTGWSIASVLGDTCTPAQVSGDQWQATNIQQACAVSATFAINTYVVMANTGAGQGLITPVVQVTDHGGDATFTVTPQTGWSVTTVVGDTCNPMLDSGDQWVAENITEACAVTANFAQDSFEVTAEVISGQGNITPASQNVLFDGTANFTVTPQTGWSIDAVAGDSCSPELVSGDQWQATGIQQACAVGASFVINTYTVTAATGAGQGTITPASQPVDHGSDASFTVTPDIGWSVTSVTGTTCTPMLDSGDQWVAENITEDCAVTANFAQDVFEVTASVDSGLGSIAPPTQNVIFDGAAEFTVTPETGWSITSVVGDTCSPELVAGDQWQATNIQQACAVTASFVINTYTVTAETGAGQGTITPATQPVDHGSDASFTVTPDIGWSVTSVTGTTCTPMLDSGDQWTAENISEDCAVTANFAQDVFEVTASVASGLGSITPPTQNVIFDGTATFTVTPETGWSTASVLGDTCTPQLVAGDQWQATNIQQACAVQASFEINVYTVTAGVGSGEGSISPPSQPVEHGSDASFTVTPDAGWSVTTVTGTTCNPVLDAGDQWVAENITEDCAVTANFFQDVYTIGGEVSGLLGSGLQLSLNDEQVLNIDSYGSFTFAQALADGSDYSVTVLSQPTVPAQACTVANGQGTLDANDITDIEVTCSTNTYSVGGTLSGLAPGNSITLRNNDADDLVVEANGAFSFATALQDLSPYVVSIAAQPTGQVCTLENNTGTLAGSDVDDITVSCLNLTLGLGSANIQFANLTAGETIEQPLVLTNTGTGTLVIEAFAAPSAPFGFNPGSCDTLPRTLEPGESCTLLLSFAPISAGTFNDQLNIFSNALDSPSRVDLSGSSASAPVPVPILGPFGLLLMMLGMLAVAARQIRKNDNFSQS